MIVGYVVMRKWMLTDDVKLALDALAIINERHFADMEEKNGRVRLHYKFNNEAGKLDFKRAADNYLYNTFAGD